MLSSRTRSCMLESSTKVTAIPDGSATPLASRKKILWPLRAIDRLVDRLDEITSDRTTDAAVGQADHVVLHTATNFESMLTDPNSLTSTPPGGRGRHSGSC